MEKLDLPITLNTYDADRESCLKWMKDLKATRIFVCGLDSMVECHPVWDPHKRPVVEDFIRDIRNLGMEAGIWINSFGHGDLDGIEINPKNQKLMGPTGCTTSWGTCPLDEDFAVRYLIFVKELATLQPDLIMIDDDFRLSQRTYVHGCFCPLHMAKMQEILGEEISREQLGEKIFSGKNSRYRRVYLGVMRNTLLDFAKKLRTAVDEVNPDIRLGVCMDLDVWDQNGTDGIELAKILAGKNKPFLRTNGAPYWQICNTTWGDIISTVEYTRMQMQWCKGYDIECIGEGDTYPRPRINIPANHLEIFHLMMTASGQMDSFLKYIVDYAHHSNFDNGYKERHIRNEIHRTALDSLFSGKKASGVYLYEAMKKTADYDLTDTPGNRMEHVLHSFFGRAQYMLAHNGVATQYSDPNNIVAAFGENARSLPAEYLDRGVITDCVGARILTERGFDVGFVSYDRKTERTEYFLKESDRFVFNSIQTCSMQCAEKAEVLSVYEPSGAVASYRYENQKGQRFLVFGYDSYATPAFIKWTTYLLHTFRQNQLVTELEWLGRKPLDVVSLGNPYLYVLTSKSEDESEMSVGLFNVFDDDVYRCEVTLGREYNEISFINCTGRMDGNKVVLEGEIPPYGYAAFTVK